MLHVVFVDFSGVTDTCLFALHVHVCSLIDALPYSLPTGHSIQEASEDGESLLSLACSAGYYELAEVLLRMRASVEDRGIKGIERCVCVCVCVQYC